MVATVCFGTRVFADAIADRSGMPCCFGEFARKPQTEVCRARAGRNRGQRHGADCALDAATPTNEGGREALRTVWKCRIEFRQASRLRH